LRTGPDGGHGKLIRIGAGGRPLDRGLHHDRRSSILATGTRLLVEDTKDCVLLRAAPIFPPPLPEDVFGSLLYTGEPKSLEQMDAGIAAEARRRHDRDPVLIGVPHPPGLTPRTGRSIIAPRIRERLGGSAST